MDAADSSGADPPEAAAARRRLAEREADRAALARFLHDDAAQTLANLALHLQICERAITVDVERGRAELSGARTALGEAINRIRQQVFRLRPLILEEVGVGPTLRRYAATFAARDGVTVDVVDGLGAARLDPQTELGLYRIGQSALDNAITHAGASAIVVELAPGSGSVALSVRDDGKGFDAATILSELETGHATGGLRAIADWSRALGADLAVTSDGTGTRVRVLVPGSQGSP